MTTPTSSTTQQQPVYCINCGQKILARARFCRNCGAIQEIEGVEIQLVQSLDPTSPADKKIISTAVPARVVPSQTLAPGHQSETETKLQQLRRMVEIWRQKRDTIKKSWGPSVGQFIVLLLFIGFGIATLGYQSQLQSEAKGLRATMTAVAEEATAVTELGATHTALVQSGYGCTFDQIKQVYEMLNSRTDPLHTSPENLKDLLNIMAEYELAEPCIIESEGLTIIDAALKYVDQYNLDVLPRITGGTLSSPQFQEDNTPTPLPTSSIHP